MFEDFVITNHIIDRYEERIRAKRDEVIKRIKRDLHFTKVKKIVNKGNIRHVFTYNSKEFIFVKDGATWILKTIIKHNRERQPSIIKKRKSAM